MYTYIYLPNEKGVLIFELYSKCSCPMCGFFSFCVSGNSMGRLATGVECAFSLCYARYTRIDEDVLRQINTNSCSKISQLDAVLTTECS